MRLHRLSFLLVLFAICIVSCAPSPEGRIVLDMNTGWAFLRGDTVDGQRTSLDISSWMPATVPHVMQLEKRHCSDDIIYEGIGWYRRNFSVPRSYSGRRLVIAFEGVMTNCQVWVNDSLLCAHYGGYMGFNVDVTDVVHYGGNNVLAVRVEAGGDPLTPPGKKQRNLDFYYYSGIYRDVRLVATAPLHITDPVESTTVAGGGVFVTYPLVTDSVARVAVKTELAGGLADGGDSQLSTLLLDAEGHTVAQETVPCVFDQADTLTLSQQFSVDTPHLWTPSVPYLYTLVSRVERTDGTLIDEVTHRVGIRSLRFDAEEGFFLNGQHLYLVGGNLHEAFPYVGDAASNSMQVRDAIDMKRAGFNAVRATQYPHDPSFLDACDSLGLLVIECIPGWQFYNRDPVFSDRLEDVGRRMVRRDRNHPSVFLWETTLNETVYPIATVARISRATHEEYPGDQFFTVSDYLGYDELLPYYEVFYKMVAHYPASGDVMDNVLEDFLALRPQLTREWGDGVGWKPRVYISEDEEQQLLQVTERIRFLEGQGYFDWCMLDANPAMAGHFLWSYNDYNRGCDTDICGSGIVDINRWPKFGYHYFRSMASPRAVQPAAAQAGPMVFIASFNSSPQLTSSTTGITVFSNCDSVTLSRNGHRIGTQTREERTPTSPHVVARWGNPIYQFDAGGYEAGTLTAEGWLDGRVAATHSVSTPGAPHHLEVVPALRGISPVADGSDMIPVYVKVVDADGTLVPDADVTVDIAVAGEGSLIGAGVPRIGVEHQRAEGGIAFAFVRTTRRAGSVAISASAAGLEGGSASVSTLPATTVAAPGRMPRLNGKEDDGAVERPDELGRRLMAMTHLTPASVKVTSSHASYPAANLTDHDDNTWWIAADESVPQVVTVTFDAPTRIDLMRVRFQKDSTHYGYQVETTTDGHDWQLLHQEEVTGWDFRPRPVEREVMAVRVTITSVSHAAAGIADLSFYAD